MEPYNIISSGSNGNCVIYNDSIMVDIGVSYKLIEPYENDIQIVLPTHKHADHLNVNTLKKLQFNRPSIRVAVGEWMLPLLDGIKNIDVLDFGKWYDYGPFQIALVKLYHDVPNCGYRIVKDGHKTFHATDTQHLQGISAKNYDLYAIEHNYDEETIHDIIAAKEAKGEFAHQRGSINSHLSGQQAEQFFFLNKGPESKLIRLHESEHKY